MNYLKEIKRITHKTFLYSTATTLIGGSYLGYPYYLIIAMEITEPPFYNSFDMMGQYTTAGIIMTTPIITNWIGTLVLQEALRH